MWAGVPIAQFDLMQEMTGASIRQILSPTVFPNAGFLAWMMIVCMSVSSCVAKKRTAGLALSPIFLLWLTLMLAAPLAVSMRYFFVAEFMFPVYMLLPFILRQKSDRVALALDRDLAKRST